MSNTITIKDPNGNIVCSVENVDPIKSEEGVLKEIVKDPGLLMGTVFLTAIGAFVGISSIKDKIDARKAEKAKAILEQNKQAILNSPQYKEIVNRTNNIAKVLSKITVDFNVYFRRELDKLAKTNQIIGKYKQDLLKGLWEPFSEEKIKSKISQAVLSVYLGKDDLDKNLALLSVPIFDYEDAGVEISDDWDDIWPVIDDLIYRFKLPSGGIFDKIGLDFEDSGWDLRTISCNIISLFSDIKINVDQN